MDHKLVSWWTRLTLRMPNEERFEVAQSSRLRAHSAATVPGGLTTGDLPDEVFERILEQLDPQHLCNAASTCRRWAHATASERVWCSLYLRHPKMAGGSLGSFDLDELDPENPQLRLAAEQQLQCCCEQGRHSGWREICQKELLLPRLEPAREVDDDTDYAILKVVQLGDSGVGKTRFLESFIEEESSQPELGSPHLPTIGIDFKVKKARLNSAAIKVQVWDTAGLERFHAITRAYYRGAEGFVCMFDVTKRSSFDNIRDIWLKVEAHDPGFLGKPIVIIGIRHDQTTSRHRAVEPTEGHSLARDLQKSGNVGRVRYAEANPVTGEGVSRAMACLVEQVLFNQELNGPSVHSLDSASPVPTKQSRMNSISASLSSVKRRFCMQRDESLSERLMTHVAMLHGKAVQTLS